MEGDLVKKALATEAGGPEFESPEPSNAWEGGRQRQQSPWKLVGLAYEVEKDDNNKKDTLFQTR